MPGWSFWSLASFFFCMWQVLDGSYVSLHNFVWLMSSNILISRLTAHIWQVVRLIWFVGKKWRKNTSLTLWLLFFGGSVFLFKRLEQRRFLCDLTLKNKFYNPLRPVSRILKHRKRVATASWSRHRTGHCFMPAFSIVVYISIVIRYPAI